MLAFVQRISIQKGSMNENKISGFELRKVCQILWVSCHRGSRESSSIVPSRLCGYFVGPKFFSWVFVARKFFWGVFHESKNFSCEYFVGPKVLFVRINLFS